MTSEGSAPNTTEEGFLLNPKDWSPAFAEAVASSEGLIGLTESHWEIIYLVQRYFEEFDASPAMRALVKFTAKHLGEDKGRSIYLLALFPGSPAKLVSKLAGLPKPANCL